LDEREQRLLAMLSDLPKNLEQLVKQRLLYPANFESPWVAACERRTISQHLDELLRAERVQVDEVGVYRIA